VIANYRGREESGQLEPAMTVWRTHHGDLHAHVVQSSDSVCPVSFDWRTPLELETKLGEECYGGIEVFHNDADVVHSFDGHAITAVWYGLGRDVPLPDYVAARRGCINLNMSKRSEHRIDPDEVVGPGLMNR
jgi:hypothetical protein